MLFKFKHNDCQKTKNLLVRSIERYSLKGNGYLANHIANCPSCQRRVSGYNRLELALSALKSQSHSIDLLARANEKTLRHLKRNVRNVPVAMQLKNARPRESFLAKYTGRIQGISNSAACLAIFILLKMGIFNGIHTIEDKGQHIVCNYYDNHLDDDSDFSSNLYQA